jgi:hypothetical protein
MDKKRLVVFPILFGIVLAVKLIAPHYSALPIPGLGFLFTIVTLAISFFYAYYPIIKRRKKMMIMEEDTDDDSTGVKNNLIEMFGGISISILLIGILFLTMHWPGAKMNLYAGMFGCMVIAILCAKQWGTNINARHHLFLLIIYISFALIASHINSIPSPNINVAQNIPGRWVAENKVSYILTQDSLYYQEVSNEDFSKWEILFNPDGTYSVDYNYRLKYEGQYEIKGDSLIRMSDRDSFPCRNALVTFRYITNMKMKTHSINEDGNNVKTEIYFHRIH